MAAPELLNVSATWGSQVGNCQGFTWAQLEELRAIQNEDSVNDDVLGRYRSTFSAEVDFLYSPIALAQANHSLVIITRDTGGNTLTTTITNMYCYAVSKSKGGAGDLAIYKHSFRSLGASTLTQA